MQVREFFTDRMRVLPTIGRPAVAAVVVAVAVGTGGCGSPAMHDGLESPNSAARIQAASRMPVETRDDARRLLPLLDDEDVVVRQTAIVRLESWSGTSFGYDPSADRRVREAAIQRWVEYLGTAGDGGIR